MHKVLGRVAASDRVLILVFEMEEVIMFAPKKFVYETLIGWGLNSEKTYSFKGEYLEEQKMVVFCLKSAD